MQLPKLTLLTFVGLILLCCNTAPDRSSLFTLMDETGIHFSNDIDNTPDFNIFSYRNFYNGAGVGIGDLNNDGLPEVFFAANMRENKLFLNKGNWEFEDISATAGLKQAGKWATGVTFADINGDGLLDIYVCYAGYQEGMDLQNELYINQGNLKFIESAAAYGLNDSGYTTHTAFFDYDLDGDLDAYILNNSFIPVNTLNYANKRELPAAEWPVADFLKGGGDKLLRNDGGRFTDVSTSAGIYGSLIGFGLGVTVGDVNADGYPDLYISNDFFERDYLYINQGDGTFKESIEEAMQHISLTSMGADIADINNDGLQDIFTTDMLPAKDARLKTTTTFENIDVRRLMQRQGFYNQYMQNTLQVNAGNGMFRETGYYSGVAASDWSWGGLIFDMDNDGFSDIFVSNGIYHDITDQDFIDFFADEVIQRMALTGKKEQIDEIISRMPNTPIPNAVFRNNGNLKFTEVATSWGLDQPSFSNGSAYGDLDNDGDLDLITNNVNGDAFVYRNNAREQGTQHFLGIVLEGKAPNTFAVGSTIKVYQQDRIYSRQVMPSRGFQSSVDYKNIIGLGTGSVDSVKIIWPDKSSTLLIDLQRDSTYRIRQENTIHYTDQQLPVSNTYFIPEKNSFIRHVEDDHVDFYSERNIPVMLSREGPKAAVADVNGDGMEDIYIGGAAGQPGTLYIQDQQGFRMRQQQVFEDFKASEDDAVLFMDFDADGDMDLFIGSGGNKFKPGSEELKNRLYINDGRGNFSLKTTGIPGGDANTGVLAAADINNDGFPELFIGNRNATADYGKSPANALLLNQGSGGFTNLAAGTALEFCGMVRAAEWADVNGDGRKELIVVGDWMSPQVYTVRPDGIELMASGLEDYTGLWQSLATADIDGDGDMDLILGNFGENFYLRPQPEEPVRLWINDFDGNGTADKIISRTISGKDMPVFMKRDLTDQIPSLKKQNLKNRDYAEKTIQQLFPKELIEKAEVKTFRNSASGIARNDGSGRFTFEAFPAVVQLSCVNALQLVDVNSDGHPDIITGGNNFHFLPQFGRLDAGFGDILINDGKGNFHAVKAGETGLNIRGMVRDIQLIQRSDGPGLLFLQNDGLPEFFKLNRN